MSEHTLHSTDQVHNQYSDPFLPIEDHEVIDVTEFDFNGIQNFLYVPPTQTSTLSTVEDLLLWLKSDPESDLSMNDTSNKKFVDTRTFTRPKKRISRMSFESAAETLSPTVSNTLKIQSPLIGAGDQTNRKRFERVEAMESVPFMLRPTPTAIVNLMSEENLSTSGNESLEAILNMSELNGVDSFINLTQSAILCSSITSLSQDSPHNMDCDTITDSETASRLFQENKRSDRSNSYNIDETFVAEQNDVTVIQKKAFTNNTDETYINICDMADDLNRTFTNPNSMDTSTNPKCSNDVPDSKDFHSTFVAASEQIMSNNVIHRNRDNYQTMDTQKLQNITTVQPSSCKGLNETQVFASEDNRTFNTMAKAPDAHSAQESPEHKHTLNSTFVASSNQGQEMSDTIVYSKTKVPTSLRRELLAEVERSSSQELDSTYDHIPTTANEDAKENLDLPYEHYHSMDKYNTYRKNPPKEHSLESKNLQNSTLLCDQKNSQDRRYYTFTKKTNKVDRKPVTENTETLVNMEATFNKPLSKLPKKKYRGISRLPQFLQKSNPNLVSNSLKTSHIVDGTNMPNVSYVKGSQPDILKINKSLTKLSLGKLKSGSDQRLVEVNPSEFQIVGAGGSTESIESTQSAHSAPDLDDRLSICSDSSHNSYTRCTMNIEQLHQIVKMQEESLEQESTPRPNRRVLENTWMEEKRCMPSPIMKTDSELAESNFSSLRSTEPILTSSPISSSWSSQSSNTNGNPKENAPKEEIREIAVKPQEVTNKVPVNKTRLKQPAQWNIGSRTNATSGIPRPASRIPAPRFARPNAKNTQADLKKGHL